jgi:hypothetical protein
MRNIHGLNPSMETLRMGRQPEIAFWRAIGITETQMIDR